MYALLLALACGGPPAEPPRPPPPVASAAATPPAPERATLRVVFLGDSLSAGMGLPADQAFPALLERAWQEQGLPVQVVNAGVSGDTTAGGVRRLDWLLGQAPDVLVVELGANDMFRGLPVPEIEANLRTLVRRGQEAGAAVVLLGMRGNPTLGPDYAAAFDAMYPRVAAELGVPLLPFVLEGVAGDPALNQADGIHPTAEGHRKISALVEPTLRPVLDARLAARAQP